MTGPTRITVEEGAEMVLEVLADILVDTRPQDLAGYVVIGLMANGGGFKIASNAGSDLDEIAILATVIEHLQRALDIPTPDS